jgi:hypothetical protein
MHLLPCENPRREDQFRPDQKSGLFLSFQNRNHKLAIELSFRQSNKFDEQLWRNNHRDENLASGVPADIFNDARRWSFLLQEDWDFKTKWSSSSLSDAEAIRLLSILDPHYTPLQSSDLIQNLKRRLKRS